MTGERMSCGANSPGWRLFDPKGLEAAAPYVKKGGWRELLNPIEPGEVYELLLRS
jgi:hypothetical protein